LLSLSANWAMKPMAWGWFGASCNTRNHRLFASSVRPRCVASTAARSASLSKELSTLIALVCGHPRCALSWLHSCDRARELKPDFNSQTIEFAANDALRRGDAQAAGKLYEQIVAQGSASASTWLGLAHARRVLRDSEASLAAVDKAIDLEPQSVRALLFKADHFSKVGDHRAAAAFYTSALRNASARGSVPPDLVEDLRRAKALCERYAKQFEDHISGRLASLGTQPSPRFNQSLDLLFGRKQLYLQQPSQYYFPELPQMQFYGRENFPWLNNVEAKTDDIRHELQDVLENGNSFRPYVESVPDRPRPDNVAMIDNPDWSAFFLWKNGEIVAQNAARCPKTLQALESVPLCRIAGRTPSILFSQLRPGARIPPHTGYINTRLICHLPLIVPDGCGFRVGNDVRAWQVGKAWAFDDTVEHEAWNNSRETRVVLIFEVWKPELSDEERSLIQALLEAIDVYRGRRDPWDA
jgi:aspartyl/asparaginyl beta-hydroxylase (cupin superfamily)